MDIELRKKTGCTLIAVQQDSEMEINPDPNQPLPTAGEVIMLATVDDEARFIREYPMAEVRS